MNTPETIRLDDFVVGRKSKCKYAFYNLNDNDESRWAYLCPDCAEKYRISEDLLEDCNIEGCLCSVEGCCYEAEWYLNIPDGVKGPGEEESVWEIDTEFLREKEG